MVFGYCFKKHYILMPLNNYEVFYIINIHNISYNISAVLNLGQNMDMGPGIAYILGALVIGRVS